MKKTLILDTSALLAGGGKILTKLKNVKIVIPVAVLEDINQQLKSPTLTAAAASFFRIMEAIEHVEDSAERKALEANNSEVMVEPNHSTPKNSDVRSKIQNLELRHQRIIVVTLNLREETTSDLGVELVTQDPLLRMIASSVFKIKTKYVDAYLNRQDIIYSTGRSIFVADQEGMINKAIHGDEEALQGMKTIFDNNKLEHDTVPANEVFKVNNSDTTMGNTGVSIFNYNHVQGEVTSINKRLEAFGATSRSFEQAVAMHYLNDKSLPTVSLSGSAGTGKTFIAVASALHQTLETKEYDKVVVFRPLYAVERQELGFLPGNEKEKMDPWSAAIGDVMKAISPHVKEYSADQLEVLPVTHIRGRTFNKAYIIVDEAQNLEYSTLLTILSRMGEGTKAVLLWDTAQRDNMKIDKQGGMQALYQRLMSNDMFAHVTLMKNERSPMAQLAGELLEEMV